MGCSTITAPLSLSNEKNSDAATQQRTTTTTTASRRRRCRFERRQMMSTMKHIFTEDYMIRMTLDNGFRFMDSLNNERKPCFITNQMIDHHRGVVTSNAEQFGRLTRNLSMGGHCILNEPNAGGTSLYSEVLSYEVMNKCFGARLDLTEMEIEYFPYGSKKTDFSVMMHGQRVGVSVTRAFHFAHDSLFTEEDAQMLLRKKMYGVIASTGNVVRRHRWKKQVLHIWTPSMNIAILLHREYKKLDVSLRANTMVVVTIASQMSCVFSERFEDHNPPIVSFA